MNSTIIETISCAAARPLLSQFLDHALAARAGARVATHLDACAECREEFAALQRVIEIATMAPAPQVPSALKYRILNSVARQEARHRNSTLRRVTRTLRSPAEVMIGVAFGIVAALVWSHCSRVSGRGAPARPSPTAAALIIRSAPSRTSVPRMARAQIAGPRNSREHSGGVSSSIHDALPIFWATTTDAAAESKPGPTVRGPLSAAESTPDDAQPQPEPASDEAPMIVAEMPISVMMTAAMEGSAPPDIRETGSSDSTTMSDSPAT